MAWVGCITDAGRNYFDTYIAQGDSININVVKTGTGFVAEEDMRSSTALVSQIDTGSIISRRVVDVGVEIRCEVSPYTTAYFLKEVGLFATITSGGQTTNAMIALLQNEDGVLIPNVAEFPDFKLILVSVLDIDNDGSLTITPPSGTCVPVYQGVENAGKFMVVSSDGVIIPKAIPFADGSVF